MEIMGRLKQLKEWKEFLPQLPKFQCQGRVPNSVNSQPANLKVNKWLKGKKFLRRIKNGGNNKFG